MASRRATNGGGRRPKGSTGENLRAIELDTMAIRGDARAAMGVAGRAEKTPLDAVLRASGSGWYPLLALTALVGTEALMQSAMMFAVADARRAIGATTTGSLELFRLVAASALALTTVVSLHQRNRVTVLRVAVGVGAAGTLATAFATSPPTFTLPAVLTAGTVGAATVVALPLLADLHRTELRVRAMAAYAVGVFSGIAMAALMNAVGSGAGLTWRVPLVLSAMVAVVAVAVAGRLHDVPVGVHDRRRVRNIVERSLDSSAPAAVSDPAMTTIGTAEQLRRVLAPVTVRRLLPLAGVVGAFLYGTTPFIDMFLRDRWDLVAPARMLAYGGLATLGVLGAVWFGRRSEVLLRGSLAAFLWLSCSVTAITAVVLSGAVVAPVFALAFAGLALAFAGFAAALVAAVSGVFAVTDPARRAHAAALLLTTALLGGIVGRQIVATIGSRFGVTWGFIAMAAVVLGVARGVGSAVPKADGDLDATVDRMVESDELWARTARGEHVPLLSCRQVDFSYGPVQVLFDVSLTVDDGEMVALLGTNGAGKSTLLRVISGLSFPSSGSIYYRGSDVTFLDTDQRVGLGISQVPGGHAVFGALSVVDNLRAYGFTIRDGRRLEQGIEDAFAAFPALASRRDQLAATLSGGEQQMLALAKALLLRPRLLLIDELSLGLAPIIVGQLLDMVRQINDAGTAVVLVEQSVNVALSVVDHAYFMEKGEIRFDGSAQNLLARPDLLRSVFLQGATSGTAGRRQR